MVFRSDDHERYCHECGTWLGGRQRPYEKGGHYFCDQLCHNEWELQQKVVLLDDYRKQKGGVK